MNQKKLVKLFALFSCYCLLLLNFRIVATETKGYIFLVWNLFLAYIPFILGFVLKKVADINYLFYPLLFTWLFFLPNAPYIITDIFHLKNSTTMPQWFDLLLVISFAINGTFVFFISLYQLYDLMEKKFSKNVSNIIIHLVIILTGFGIYLGRFLRWNTWDIVAKPKLLFYDIFDRFINPMSHPKTWGVTIGYSIFLFFGFQFIKLLLSNQKTEHE